MLECRADISREVCPPSAKDDRPFARQQRSISIATLRLMTRVLGLGRLVQSQVHR
jgi:hypothetical protein